jgi:hypothetical protein
MELRAPCPRLRIHDIHLQVRARAAARHADRARLHRLYNCALAVVAVHHKQGIRLSRDIGAAILCRRVFARHI